VIETRVFDTIYVFELDGRRECPWTLPSLRRSTAFSRVTDNTSLVDYTASHPRSRNFETVFFYEALHFETPRNAKAAEQRD
jgi:hypothetical protein